MSYSWFVEAQDKKLSLLAMTCSTTSPAEVSRDRDA